MRSNEDLTHGLQEMIERLPKTDKGLVMIEIGSYRGESAQMFLDSGKVRRIYCVDPWQPLYDKTDAAAFTDMEKVEKTFDARFKDVPQVVKVKGTINTFVENFKSDVEQSEGIDFVYIDGCHTEEATAHDIAVSMDVLKPRVAIAGHDYGAGVKKAVDSRFGAPDERFRDMSWLNWIKR